MLDAATVADFMSIMQEQLKVLRDMTEIGDKKTKALVGANLADLDVLVKGEQALLVHLNRVEGKRYQVQERLAVQCGLPVDAFSLSAFLQRAPREQFEELDHLQNEYRDLVSQLEGQQETNAALIHQAMQYIDFNLKIITGSGTQAKAGTYTASGQRQGAQVRPNKLMDGRA